MLVFLENVSMSIWLYYSWVPKDDFKTVFIAATLAYILSLCVKAVFYMFLHPWSELIFNEPFVFFTGHPKNEKRITKSSSAKAKKSALTWLLMISFGFGCSVTIGAHHWLANEPARCYLTGQCNVRQCQVAHIT